MSAEVENKSLVEEEKAVAVDDKDKETKKAEEATTPEKKGADEPVVEAPPPPPPVRVHKTEFEKDVVYLYQFCRTPLLPSLSPYCLKVETWLRLNGIKYENVDHKLKFRSSKGQLPFVELNGEEIADSAVIVSKLSQHYGADLDAQLTKEEKNSSHALVSMIENHLNWVYVYWRAKNPAIWIKGVKLSLQHALGSRIPNPLLNFVFRMTYGRKGGKKVKAHGMGVHSAEEVFEFGKQDLTVLEDTLGDKQFFFGEKPTTLDVVAFAHLSQIAFVDKCVEYDLRDWMADNCPQLMGFLDRLKERSFPDWEEITSTLKMNTHIPEPEPEEEKKDVEKEPKEKEANEKEVIKEEGKEKDEKEETKKEVEESK